MNSKETKGILEELEAVLLRLRKSDPRGGRFVAERVVGRPWVRAAVGTDGIAVLLPAVAEDVRAPIEFANLRIRFNVNCTLETSEGVVEDTLVIVRCMSSEPSIEKAFLKALSVVLPRGQTVIASDLEESIKGFAELFRTLQSPAIGTVMGLWGELFVISEASNSYVAVDAWHSLPMERFDFGRDALRVEVKTTLSTIRSHHFSLEQLRPAKGVRVVTASVLTSSFVGGSSISVLLKRINEQLDPERASRVTRIAMQTLGRDWDTGSGQAFDEQLARQTLNWYLASSVPAVSGVESSVSEVRFRSNLSGVRPLSPTKFRSEGTLAQALIGTANR